MSHHLTFYDDERREYLTGIHEHQKLKTKTPARGIVCGDIVHIYQDDIYQWRMGRVTKVFPGQDGNIRSAEVATLDPSGQVIHVKRPLEKLYPLEVRSTANVEGKAKRSTNSTNYG